MSDLQTLEQQSLAAVANLGDLRELEDARVRLLGKSGEITQQLQKIGSLPPEERKDFGAQVNQVKLTVQAALEEQKTKLEQAAISAQLANESIDVTLPASPLHTGKLHPLTATIMEVEQVLLRLGFAPTSGPEIDQDDINFTMLNIPPEHPARQDHDTFYLVDKDPEGKEQVLRTQTSNIQIRTMLNHKPPLRIQSIGKVFRNETPDATHTPMFHQIEGLALDKDITFADLRGVLQRFLEDFFERPVKMRMRPFYFPFTEPSAEIDIWWESSKGGRWLEILGCGMVHRNVLNACGIDHNEYQGFAFGCGVERLATLKHGMKDIRNFYDGYRGFLGHYGAPAGQTK